MDALQNLVTSEQTLLWLRAALVLVFGLILARLISAAIYRGLVGAMGPHTATTARRMVSYALYGIVVTAVLHQLGFNLGVLLGAAGLATVAIGFAAQTSTSNLVSGLFLVAERPFEIGDTIRVGSTTGQVLSIDLLSVKLRTFDNLFVRVPNESLIKGEITNLSRFPIRRADLKIGIAYKEDLPAVHKLLTRIADANPLVLYEPRPLIIFQGFGDSSVNLQFSIWAARENFLAVQNELAARILQAFAEEGIEIPFPQRAIQPASLAAPMPVTIVSGTETPDQKPGREPAADLR